MANLDSIKLHVRTIVLCLFAIAGCESSQPIPTSTPTSVPHPQSRPAVFIGDSIIEHWTELETLVPDSINAGIGGEITEQMLNRFDRDVLAHNPRVVVIEGGINDIVSQFGPTPRHIAAMAERASIQGARVVLIAITPTNTHSWVSELSQIWNEELRLTAQSYGYVYVDFGPALSQHSNALYSDGVHITPEGYEVMWPILKTTLTKHREIMPL